MHTDPQAATNGSSSSSSSVAPPAGAPGEFDELQSRYRRQAQVIDTLSAAVSALRMGAKALKAENAELRAAHDPGRREARGRLHGATQGAEPNQVVTVQLGVDDKAPAVARVTVACFLNERGVAATVLETAQLAVTELVSNSVRHSGASAEQTLTLRVALSRATSSVRVEVEDPGREGAVAPRPPDLNGGGGLGLNFIQAISERWGVERVAGGGTHVWAQLALGATTPPPAAAIDPAR
jgi:anti-sigma regulatory factor (Ser/Thr protein kinase)